MAYFSCLEIERREVDKEDVQNRREEKLRRRLMFLEERLAIMEDRRPRDPLHPLFDRYFYTEFYYGQEAVQSILEEIDRVQEALQEYETAAERMRYLLESVCATGATPEGQYAVAAVFAPILYGLSADGRVKNSWLR